MQQKSPETFISGLFVQVGDYLFSRAVSSELSSAQVSLTSVFGMGTGGTHRHRHRPYDWLSIPYGLLFVQCFLEGRAFKTE